MANTKTISGSGSRGYSAYLYLTETGTDVATNKSTISYSLVLYSGNYSFSQYELGWSVYVNGTSVAYQNYSSHQDSISANSSKTLASGTTTVTHDADGSKTISVSAYVDCVYGSYGPGDIDLGSSTWSLTAIPRASSLSVSNGTLGTSQNITITPAVASYTHTLTYSCGSTSGTIASGISGSTSGFTQAWTPPLSLASQNTTGTSVSVTVRCETFYNSTSVGSKSVTVTMAMPASIKPSVSMTLSDAMGYLSTYGAYIQNKSKLGVIVNTTASYGSAISSYNVKIGTRLTYTSANFTSDVLPESGSISVVATVTDRRGRSNSATTTITVAPYSPPSITDIGIYRSNSSGTASATGTYATVTFKASVSPITVGGTAQNTATYTLMYKSSTTSSWSTSTLSYSNVFNVTNGKATFNAAATNAYDAQIRIADRFGTVDSITVRVQSAASYFKADPVNNAFSFGQLGVTANTFTCAWAAVFNGTASFGSTVTVDGIGNLKSAIDGKATLLQVYPVGSIYMSTVNTNPGTLFGGTWVAWGTGRVPVGVNTSDTDFNTVEKTGGSKAMQKHSHTRGTMDITGTLGFENSSSDAGVDASPYGTGAFTSESYQGTGSGSSVAGTNWWTTKGWKFKASDNWTGSTSEAGTGTSGNLQPYITCYMWKRTA